MTRVRLRPSSVNVTVPSTWPLAPFDFHTMCESGTCSRIVASQVRCDQRTCACQFVFSSDSWSTVSTFFMNSGKSPNWVHRLYVVRSGKPMSMFSEITVTLSFFPEPGLLPASARAERALDLLGYCAESGTDDRLPPFAAGLTVVGLPGRRAGRT